MHWGVERHKRGGKVALEVRALISLNYTLAGPEIAVALNVLGLSINSCLRKRIQHLFGTRNWDVG
jgi:hypothetical protein